MELVCKCGGEEMCARVVGVVKEHKQNLSMRSANVIPSVIVSNACRYWLDEMDAAA